MTADDLRWADHLFGHSSPDDIYKNHAKSGAKGCKCPKEQQKTFLGALLSGNLLGTKFAHMRGIIVLLKGDPVECTAKPAGSAMLI